MSLLKKILCGLLSAVTVCTFASLPTMARDDIKVVLDGKTISFDVQPQIINDRTMVPLRAIFEALGARVYWNENTQEVTSYRGNTAVSLTIGSKRMYVDYTYVTIDVPACIIGDRTFVPLRAISEAYGTDVEWDNYTRTVNMYSNNESNYKEPTPTPKPTQKPTPTPKPTQKPKTASVVSIKDMDNIGDVYSFGSVSRSDLNDSYGNTYSYGLYGFDNRTYQTLLNGNYNRFKCTLFTPSGCSSNDTTRIIIKADGEKVYTSPVLDKTLKPVNVDIDITGCNNFEITVETDGWHEVGLIGDAEFYKNSSSSSSSTGNTEKRSGPHCPNCGSTSFVQLNGGRFICSECGTQY